VSLLATSVDFGVFHSLGWWSSVLPNGVAAFVSAGCGAVVSWLLNRYWVFAHAAVATWSAGVRYLLGVGLCIVLNALAVAILCDTFQLPRMWGRTMAALSVWVVLFWFNRRVVFRV
jgi:putative flippase GtrA